MKSETGFLRRCTIREARSITVLIVAALFLSLAASPAFAVTEQAKLTASNGLDEDEFGTSVAIDGDTAVVGSFDDDGADVGVGSAYVYTRSGTTWSEQQQLKAGDGQALDFFGTSVAIDGDTLVVGADLHQHGAVIGGSAYVFTRSGTAWSEQAELIAPTVDDEDWDAFGFSVAISGNTAVVGAPANVVNDVTGNPEQAANGAAYVFTRSGTTWSLQQKLTASDGAIYDFFGSAVSIEGDTIVVGADRDSSKFSASGTGQPDGPGAAYVFTRSGSTWSQHAKLESFDGANGDRFGVSVGISGDTIVVGANKTDDTGSRSGSAYVFTRNPALDPCPIDSQPDPWCEQVELTASDAAAFDQFGYSVAIEGETVLVGSWFDDDAGDHTGSAYLYTRSGTTWTERAKLLASDAQAEEEFGGAVAISGNSALIGAVPGSDSDPTNTLVLPGSAYVFTTCSFTTYGTLIHNRWEEISLYCDPGSANTVEDVFGDDLPPADYGITWVIFGKNAAGSNVMLGLSDVMEQGKGYWAIHIIGGVDDEVIWDATGTETPVVLPSVPTVVNSNCPSTEGCYEIPLVSPTTPGTRTNLLGHALEEDVDWSKVLIEVDGTHTCTPAEAAGNNLIVNTVWDYNGTAYDQFNDVVPPETSGGSLKVTKGFWIKTSGGAVGKALKLLVPKGAFAPPVTTCDGVTSVSSGWGVDGYVYNERESVQRESGDIPWWLRWVGAAHAAEDLQRGEWWIQLIVNSPDEGGMEDGSNYLGWHRDSVDGKDNRDLEELPPFSTPNLTIVFPHAEWGADAGDYGSDFRSVKRAKQVKGAPKDVWDFEVRTDLPGRQVTLSWRGHGIDKRLKRMRLIDVDNDKKVKAVRKGAVQTYTLTLPGTIHRFRWVYHYK